MWLEINIARINFPVPPDEHAPPKVRTGIMYIIDWLLISVFPWIIFYESDLIHQFTPKFFHAFWIIRTRDLHSWNTGDYLYFWVVALSNILKTPDVAINFFKFTVNPQFTVGRFRSSISRKNNCINTWFLPRCHPSMYYFINVFWISVFWKNSWDAIDICKENQNHFVIIFIKCWI